MRNGFTKTLLFSVTLVLLISCNFIFMFIGASGDNSLNAQTVSSTGSSENSGDIPIDEEVPELETVYRKGMVSGGLYHTVLLNESGDVYAWGDNSFGQLGIGSLTNKEIPMKVEGISDVIMVSAGAYHTLALTSTGDVYAWGRNTYGQVGNGTTLMSMSPVRISGIPPMKEISAGAFHSLGVGIDGYVYAWGENTFGQVGNVESEAVRDGSDKILGSRVITPQQVAGPDIVSVSAGGKHSLYLNLNGDVYAWGDNEFGQLGDGTVDSRANPRLVTGIGSVKSISAGYAHNMVISEFVNVTAEGNELYQNLFTWGSDSSGQLGQGGEFDEARFVSIPARVDITGDTDDFNDRISLIDAGYYSSIMSVPSISKSGIRNNLYIWGNNTYGQLGVGDMPSQNKPLKLIGESNGWTGDSFLPFQSITAGGYHTVILSVKGFVGVTGRADKGQLGIVSSINIRAFTGVSIRDAIAPEWDKGSVLMGGIVNGNMQLRWSNAKDNIKVTGYILTYMDNKGEYLTIKLGLVNVCAISGFDNSYTQLITLQAIDEAGNKSEHPLEFVAGIKPDDDFESDIISKTSDLEPISSESTVSSNDSTISEAVVSDTDESFSTDEFGSEDTSSDIDGIPVDEGSVDFLAWSPELYGTNNPLEVPWDVDYIYGTGVITPPEDHSIAYAVIITATMVGFALLFGMTSFKRNHKGHGLIEEIFRPHKDPVDPVDTSATSADEVVDIGEGIEIITDKKPNKKQ